MLKYQFGLHVLSPQERLIDFLVEIVIAIQDDLKTIPNERRYIKA